MESEKHNIQKIEKPTILQTLLELQIKLVLKIGFKISFQVFFASTVFVILSNLHTSVKLYSPTILSAESDKFVVGHEKRYLGKDL